MTSHFRFIKPSEMAGGGKHTWRSSGAPHKGESADAGRSGSSGTADDACDIRFETVLNSVDLTAIQNVNRGTILEVEIVTENSIDRLVTILNGDRVGVISHPKTLELIGCIHAGNQYVAVVVGKQGNLCRVRIERRTI